MSSKVGTGVFSIKVTESPEFRRHLEHMATWGQDDEIKEIYKTALEPLVNQARQNFVDRTNHRTYLWESEKTGKKKVKNLHRWEKRVKFSCRDWWEAKVHIMHFPLRWAELGTKPHSTVKRSAKKEKKAARKQHPGQRPLYFFTDASYQAQPLVEQLLRTLIEQSIKEHWSRR